MPLISVQSLFSTMGAQGSSASATPFVAVSVLAHVAVAAVVPQRGPAIDTPARPPIAYVVEFEAAPGPTPEPIVAEPVVEPARRTIVAAPTPTPPPTPQPEEANPVASHTVPDEAPAVVEAGVGTSTPSGLDVAAGQHESASPGAALGASHAGPTVESVAAAVAAPAEPGPFRSRYAAQLSRLMPRPDVPRSMRDRDIDAVTVIGITIDEHGRVIRVRLARGSGEADFDQLALAYYQAHGFELPAPPAEAQWGVRELPLPIRWR